jgi:Tol biopolymer transport system component
VAFTSSRSGRPEVWVVDRHGAQAVQVTSLGKDGDVGAPRWSPDSRSIAFDFSPVGGTDVDVYVVDLSGGRPRRVTTAPGVDASPSWSRDGRWIYFASKRSGQWQVWKVPPGGEGSGRATQVTRGGGFAAIESPDGRQVYFSKRMSGHQNSPNAIWRIPVEGGREEAVVESFRSSSGSWDVASDGIYFVDADPSSAGGQWILRFQKSGQRRATDVARLRHPPFLGGPAVSVSPDGRFLLSTQGQGGSDLMLADLPDPPRAGK